MKTTQRRPSRRLLALAGVVGVALFAVEAARAAGQAVPHPLGLDPRQWLGAVALVLAGAAVLDARALAQAEAPTLRRIRPRSLALVTWAEIGLELRAPRPLGPGAALVDGTPAAAEVAGLPLALDGATTERQRGRYRIRPLARGDVPYARATLSARSPYGLWRFTAPLGESETIRVLPNFAAMQRFDALARAARTRDVGMKRVRRRGEGLEFHQLREYRPGDTIRQIDWKATARKRELISREYEAEHDQRIVFLLDGSRRMRARDGELSHFDHGLNAMILLAHVAVRGGDAVGLLHLGAERRWLAPAKGAAAVHRLLHRVYDLEPTTLGLDFRGAAEELARRQRRRSMVIVLTRLQPEDAPDLLPALRLLRRRHVVLVADLRLEAVDALLARDPASTGEAFAALGAMEEALERRTLHDRLRREGARLLDVSPDELGPALVSRYRAVKSGGEL